MVEWPRFSLESLKAGQCDGVVTYCLDKGLESDSFPLAGNLFKKFR
jgi:hypothetical protein